MKISNLPSADLPVTGEEFLVLTQNGKSVRVQAVHLMGGEVDSVNGQTGEVVLTASDVGAVASVNGQSGVVILTHTDVGADPSGTAETVSTSKLNVHIANANPHTQYVLTSVGDTRYIRRVEIGAPNGVAGLDSSGKIPAALIPNLPGARKVVVADEAERLSLDPYGDLTIAYQANDGTTWALGGGQNPSVVENWTQLGEVISNVVNSFNGRTGNVVPVAGDYNTDQITTGTINKFVTDSEKTTWNNKQNALVNTVNIKSVGGKSVLGSGDIGLNPSDIGAAPAIHTHTSSDITDFGDGVGAALNTKLVAGSNVTLNYNSTNKTTTISVPNDSVQSVNGETGAVILTANKVGAAAVIHTHTSSDITDFDDSVSEIIGTNVVAGNNISVSYDQTTKQTTITATGVGGVSSVNTKTGDVILTATDVGADPAGTAATQSATAVLLHEQETDPHPQYLSTAEGDAFYVKESGFTNRVKDIVGVTVVGSSGIFTSYNPTTHTLTVDGSAISPKVFSVNGYEGSVELTHVDVSASKEYSKAERTTSAGETVAFALKNGFDGNNHGFALKHGSSVVGVSYNAMDFNKNSEGEFVYDDFIKINGGASVLTTETVQMESGEDFFISSPRFGFDIQIQSQNKLLLYSANGTVYTASGGVLSAVSYPASETDFTVNGFNDSGVIPHTTIETLDIIQVISYVGGDVQYNYYVSEPQSLYNWSPINLASFSSITGFSVNGYQAVGGSARLAFSPDGVNWFKYTGTGWGALVDNEAQTVITEGNTVIEANLIGGAIASIGSTDLYITIAFSITDPLVGTVSIESIGLVGDLVGGYQQTNDVIVNWFGDKVAFTTPQSGTYTFVYQD